MRKCLFIMMFILALAFTASADMTTQSTSSGLLTSGGVIVGQSARFTDLAVYTDGTHAVTVVCYDNATVASGTIIGQITLAGAGISGGIFMPTPVRAVRGIYCSLSGTGGSMIIFYSVQ